jgi:hypothetical protein
MKCMAEGSNKSADDCIIEVVSKNPGCRPKRPPPKAVNDSGGGS